MSERADGSGERIEDRFDRLEVRAKAAGEDLSRAARRRPRPEFDGDRLAAPERPRGGAMPYRLLGAAAVAVLIAGIVALGWRDRDGDRGRETVVGGAPAEVPAYVLDPAPEGFDALGMAEFGMGDATDGAGSGSLHLFGPVDGRAEVAVLVVAGGFHPPMTVSDERGREVEGDPVETFDLDGRRAYRGEPEFVALGAEAVTVEDGDAAIVVFGAAGREVLDAIAAVATVEDGDPVVDAGALPDGWGRSGVAGVDAMFTPTITEPESAKIVAYGLRSGPMDEAGGPVSGPTIIQLMSGRTGSMAESPAELGGVLPVLDREVTEVEVAGRPGRLRRLVLRGVDEAAAAGEVSMVALDWEPEEGRSVVLVVYGGEIGDSDMVELAESARPATDEEWRALLESTDSFAGESVESENAGGNGVESESESAEVTQGTWPAEEPGAGSTPGGGSVPMVGKSDPGAFVGEPRMVGGGGSPEVNWSGYVEDDRFWIEIHGAGDDQAVTSALMHEPFPIAVTSDGGRRVIGGHVPSGRRVEVRTDLRGEPVMGEMVQPDGSRFWFADVSGAESVGIELVEADGSVVMTRDLGWAREG